MLTVILSAALVWVLISVPSTVIMVRLFRASGLPPALSQSGAVRSDARPALPAVALPVPAAIDAAEPTGTDRELIAA